MVSFTIDIAVHPNTIVLPFIALPSLLEHLDIVGLLDVAGESVWILSTTLLLRLIVHSRLVLFVVDSIQLCDRDVGKNGLLDFSGLDLGKEKIVVIVGDERNTRFGNDA